MKAKGFVLVTSLLFLSLMMLLVLSQMQMVWLYQKSLNQLVHKHQALQVMEKQIGQIIKQLSSPRWRACLLHSDHANAVIDNLLQGKGCPYTAKGLQFRFFVEELGALACMQHVTGSQLYSTAHWRVTMASTERHILQIRVAKLIAEQPCESSKLFIQPGLLSWRFLLV